MKSLLRSDQGAGIVMLAFMALALVAANSPFAALYQAVHHTPVHLRIGELLIEGPMVYWINQGLMVIFFVIIGFEIKQQVLEGQLNTLRSAALPAFAALGGMAVPAIVYASFNQGDAVGIRGWAVPTATDIVLALSILSLMGPRVPIGLKVFLTALAVFDDIGAVIIIGVFYGEHFSLVPAVVGLAAVVGLFALNRWKVTNPVAYIIVGAVLWVGMLKAGVEAALAGVIIAAAVPMHGDRTKSKSPLRSAENTLHLWSSLLVVPLFVFFNSGVVLDEKAFSSSSEGVWLGIVLGLFLGKQVGIFGAVFLAVRSGLCRLPERVNWMQVFGVSILAGIGFTMSLFIATRAFPDPAVLSSAKLAVLSGSLLSAVIGVLVLQYATIGSGTITHD
ncbi:MAG: Na+/H+ antiporter NhaA [Alphaproteobacteria bacterium]|jgi:NhaA family Na+:H+ antiporter|uniref:Na+/H+ antiporter NhaA n=2 Tax=Alphaproteobacteria TaxID=28211 RepID=UPI000EBCAC75|nr:Na+/H+ antiporter NhaA [Hyphomonas sp.]|tara:strand:+ start:10407 stop:11576 length:1170 start_codon:yes stop_codon:yes gene_type:complete